MPFKTLRKVSGAAKHLLKQGKRTVKKGVKYAKKNPLKAAALASAAAVTAPLWMGHAAAALPSAYMSRRPKRTLRSLQKNPQVLSNPTTAAAWMINRAADNVRRDIHMWNKRHKNSAIRA